MIKRVPVSLEEGEISHVTIMGNGGLVIEETNRIITAREFEIIREAIFHL